MMLHLYYDFCNYFISYITLYGIRLKFDNNIKNIFIKQNIIIMVNTQTIYSQYISNKRPIIYYKSDLPKLRKQELWKKSQKWYMDID